MIDYELKEGEALLKLKALDFAGKEIAPNAAKLDTASKAEAADMMKNNLKKLAAAELLAPGISEDGIDLISHFVVGEEIAKACAATWLSARTTGFRCAGAIALFGTAEQKAKYLNALIKGEITGAVAYTENGAGSDLNSISAEAFMDGGEWKINGTKDLVINAPIADIFLILAWTDRNAGQASMFIVEKGAAGLKVGEAVQTLGICGCPVAPVILENCSAAGVLGGDAGKGIAQVTKILEMGRIGVAALSVGIGTACMEKSTAWAKSRKAFGKPIGAYQEVGFKLADMFTFNDLGRALGLRAAWAFNNKENEAEILAACAKVFSGEAVTKIANWAAQVFSGHGYVKGSEIERLYRDARFCEFCEGTSEVLRTVIAQNELDKFRGV
ncbi:MAG TPA: acyl-CoA dehydrogenase family protein [Desulfomonilia bacterium]